MEASHTPSPKKEKVEDSPKPAKKKRSAVEIWNRIKQGG